MVAGPPARPGKEAACSIQVASGITVDIAAVAARKPQASYASCPVLAPLCRDWRSSAGWR
jgi:hypothetical protein